MWTEPEIVEKAIGLEINSYAQCTMGDDDDTNDNDDTGDDKDNADNDNGDDATDDDDSSVDATESD